MFRSYNNNDKAQMNIYLYIAIFVIIFILIFIIFIKTGVDYSININKSEYKRGENIILTYRIENDNLFDYTSNIQLEWGVYDEYNHLEFNNTEYIPYINPYSDETGIINIETSSLRDGQYTIWTHLNYWIRGKWETKHLSLEFTIN